MNKKILIVRNDPEAAKALSFVLAGTGYRISAHNTTGSALEAVQSERYDLAIADREISGSEEQPPLVSSLKSAQPSLPVILLSDSKDVEMIIDCIRAGVTDVIDEPTNLRRIYETTNEYFRQSDNAEPEITWEDMVEVERTLADLCLGEGSAGAGSNRSARSQASSAELEAATERVGALEDELAKSQREAARLSDLLKRSAQLQEGGGSSTLLASAAELEQREQELTERASRVAKQKADVEMQRAELEAARFEFEDNGGVLPCPTDSAAEEKIAALKAEANQARLGYEARIHDLERSVEATTSAGSGAEALEQEIIRLRASLQESNETVQANQFTLDEKEKEARSAIEQLQIAKAEAEQAKAEAAVARAAAQQSSQDADNAKAGNVVQLEEEKRLLEIEKLKLQEKLGNIEQEKQELEEEFTKKQREIKVERRDAEISLRELQTQIKEEQIKLHVEQANFKEEHRQFDAARQNFQEDVQELQKKQSELVQVEKQLRDLQQTVESRSDEAAALPEGEIVTSIEAPAFHSVDSSAEQSASEADQSSKPDDDKFDAKSWSKPPEKTKGSRGPLRIGRRSGF